MFTPVQVPVLSFFTMVFATYRSKTVVPVLFLLVGLYYWALHVLKSFRALCPRVSSFLLAL